MKIVLCASFNFFEHVVQLEHELRVLGHTPCIPESAKGLKASGNFAVDPFLDASGRMDTKEKTIAIRKHFDEIAQTDAILVVNYEKHGQPNYIGPSVLMEMGVAFALHKPIYILNDMPSGSPFTDEIRGLEPIVLEGNLQAIS